MYERSRNALELYESKDPTLDGLVGLIGILISETIKRGSFSAGDWSNFFINLGSVSKFLNIQFKENIEKLNELTSEKSQQLVFQHNEFINIESQIVELKHLIDEADMNRKSLETNKNEINLLQSKKDMIEKELLLYSDESRTQLTEEYDYLSVKCDQKRSEFKKISDDLAVLKNECIEIDQQKSIKEQEYDLALSKKNEYLQLISLISSLEIELSEKESERELLKSKKESLESQCLEIDNEIDKFLILQERILSILSKFDDQKLPKSNVSLNLPESNKASSFDDVSQWLKEKMSSSSQQLYNIREVTSELLDKAENRIPEYE